MEKVFNLELSEVASPEIVKQVEEILLAVPKEESKKAITFDNFHNLIRVMYNIDYIYLEDVLSEEEFTDLRFDPCGFFIHTDDKKAHAIWNAAMKRYSGDK